MDKWTKGNLQWPKDTFAILKPCNPNFKLYHWRKRSKPTKENDRFESISKIVTEYFGDQNSIEHQKIWGIIIPFFTLFSCRALCRFIWKNLMFHIATNYFPHFWQMHENEIGTQWVNTSFSLPRRTKYLYFLKSYRALDKNYFRLLIIINNTLKIWKIIKAISKQIFLHKIPRYS